MARRVVVTGGASGIGRVMAEAFLALGDQVAVCDSSEANIQDMQRAHPKCIAHCADVRNETEMSAFFAQLEDAYGGVDVLISNAGTGGPAGGIETLTYEDWRDCVSVNLDGAFLSCRWAAARMKAQNSGAIILISSTSGLFGVPYRSPYVAAKWGLIGLMKTLAIELGSAHVRVNAICPGAVEGSRMERVLSMESKATGRPIEDIRAQYTDGVSLRCFIPPEDIAGMAVFLASDAGRNISGQAISVDGNTERMV